MSRSPLVVITDGLTRRFNRDIPNLLGQNRDKAHVLATHDLYYSIRRAVTVGDLSEAIGGTKQWPSSSQVTGQWFHSMRDFFDTYLTYITVCLRHP